MTIGNFSRYDENFKKSLFKTNINIFNNIVEQLWYELNN